MESLQGVQELPIAAQVTLEGPESHLEEKKYAAAVEICQRSLDP